MSLPVTHPIIQDALRQLDELEGDLRLRHAEYELQKAVVEMRTKRRDAMKAYVDYLKGENDGNEA